MVSNCLTSPLFFFFGFYAFPLWLSFSGSREAAFVYAISSAGVVYALTRACSQGELKTCNCDPHKRGRASDERGEFDWGGCSDNINYGIKFAKAFIDAKERTVRDARALMNLHNNRCGRTVSVWLQQRQVHQIMKDFVTHSGISTGADFYTVYPSFDISVSLIPFTPGINMQSISGNVMRITITDLCIYIWY